MISIGFLWIYWYLNAIFITSSILQNSPEYLWTVLTETWCSLLLCLILCICWLIWRKTHKSIGSVTEKNMYKLVEQAGRKALYQSDEVEWKILSVSSNKKTNPLSRADMLTEPPLEEFEQKDNILCTYFTFRNNILSPWGISKAKYFSCMCFVVVVCFYF